MSLPRLLQSTLLLAILTACATRSTDREATAVLSRFEYEEPHMGLPFRIVLYAPAQAEADAAAAAAFRRVKQLNDIMTDYDADSELSRLSRSSGQGREVPVSEDLWRVLERAQALSEKSRGAFDITVGPCVLLWRKARREKKMPDPVRLAEARQAVGYQHIRLRSGRRVAELMVPNMRLDLGGIAKGYAVDEALKVLGQHGITRALVAGAGDLAVTDPPPGKPGWRVELAPLDVTNAPAARFVILSHAGLATSGDAFQRLEIDGKRYSHIVDPHTGIGLTDHSLVTAIGPDCMTADSLTKVVSVLGPGLGLKFIANTPRVEARVVRQPGAGVEVYQTRGFEKHLEPLKPTGGRISTPESK
jgi:thiamine biosynthesis lipoprotein